MPFFRKKPVVIEARQLVVTDEVRRGVARHLTGTPSGLDLSPRVVANLEADAQARILAKWCGGRAAFDAPGPCILIDTLEGQVRADPGDWIIRGVKGEFYPCKPDIFDATYEAVE